jgi:hypothetical protein
MTPRPLFVAALAAAAVAFGALPAPVVAKKAGVAWERTPEAAHAKARRDGKPVLLLHLFGKLDEEFC